MGLFSGKKIITVSSTLYNMAGDEDDRPNFLKGTLFSSVMANSPSLADDITSSYFSGPGIKQRQFFRYADRNNLAGLPDVTATNNNPVDGATVAAVIGAPAGQECVVQNAQVNDGDPEIFFEQWILQNHPSRIGEDWLGEYDQNTGDFNLQFPNGDFYSFTNASYDPTKRYIEARYFHVIADNTQPEVIGTPVSVTSQVDLTGWDVISQSGAFQNYTLVRNAEITVVIDAGAPTVTNENADLAVQLNRSVDVYERTTTVGAVGYETEGLFERYTYTGTDHVIGGYSDTQVVVEDLGNGSTKTTTTVTTGEQVAVRWDEQHDTQTIYESTVVGGEQMFIYEVGTGEPTLDALATEADASGFQEFFPFLPIRLNNVGLRESPYDTNGLYDETKKAYRRATDLKNIDKIIDEVEDNDSIDDIDYAYIIYGVSLNVKEQACRKYAFNFFEEMIQFQNSGSNAISNFQASIAAYDQAQADLAAWLATDWDNTPWNSRPPRPVIPDISVPPTTSLNLRTGSSLMPSFDIRLQWVHIEDEQFNGKYTYTPIVGAPRDAKKDELQFVDGPDITWTEQEGFSSRDGEEFRTVTKSIPSMYMYWQVSDTQYRRLQIFGLTHYNYIYGGKSVKITSKEALADNEPSGFVIPLHYPTMKAMSIVDYTQMATANVHILFNSYEVTKQKWWQTGFFKIFLIILIIVVAVIIAPGAFAAGGGILGGNVAVGAALGLTGTAAIVAGVVANYLASIVISQLLQVVGTALFGEKWGALFAALASFALGAAISGMNIFSAEGLLGLGNALANGYAGWVQGDIAEMQEDYQNELDTYEEQMDYINDLIAGLGGNDLNFNPLFLTDSVRGNDSGRSGSGGYMPETADEFIRRTTMTGTDIVEITQSQIYDFVDVQQTLPRN